MAHPAAPAVDNDATEPSRRAWWAVLVAVLAILTAPFFFTDMPPLLDYPNHLARMKILVDGGHDPALARIYGIEWRILPNMAMDVLIPLFAEIMPLDVAGRAFAALTVMLTTLGVAALHWACFGRRSYWAFAGALIAFNALFFAGFLNFLFGAGLAMLGAAHWMRHVDRPIAKAGFGMAAALAVFFAHIIAFGFYVALIGTIEAFAAWRDRRLVQRAITLAIPLILPSTLLLIAPLAAEVAAEDGEARWNAALGALMSSKALYKLFWTLGPFLTYVAWLDTLLLAALVFVVVVCWRERSAGYAPAVLAAAALLMLAYPLAPEGFAGAGWLDVRLPILAAMVALAGFAPRFADRRAAVGLFGFLALVFVLRIGGIAWAWHGYNVQLAELRAAVAPIQPGDRVLVIRNAAAADRAARATAPLGRYFMLTNDTTWHHAAHVVLERNAFWPLLFSARDKQPVRVLPPYDRLALDEGVPPRLEDLSNPSPRVTAVHRYLADWRRDFQWVLLLNAYGQDALNPAIDGDDLPAVVVNGAAALYRNPAAEAALRPGRPTVARP